MGFALSAIKNAAQRTPIDEAVRMREMAAASLLSGWDDASRLTAGLQRLAFASLSHHRLGSDSAIEGSGLPWSLIRPRRPQQLQGQQLPQQQQQQQQQQQHPSGVDTPLQRRGAKLELHLWVLEHLSRAASGDVVGRATGVVERQAAAERAANSGSRWGGAAARAAAAAYLGLGAAAAPAGTGGGGRAAAMGSTTAAAAAAAAAADIGFENGRVPFVGWAWRDS
jgi:hypothetical protein